MRGVGTGDGVRRTGAPGDRARRWRVGRVGAPAPVLVLGSIASVQIGGAVAKHLFASAGPIGTVTLRLVLSAVLVAGWTRPRLRGRSRGDLATAVAFGLALTAMNVSFYESLDRLPLGVAVTVEFVGPLGLALAGSRHWRDMVWAVLAAGGVALLAEGSASSLLGVGLAVLAGVFWAAYIVASQRTGRRFGGVDGLAVALSVGAVLVLPAGAVTAGSALVQPRVFGLGLAVAVLSSAVPYSLELAALRRLPARVFGVLMSLEPAMAAFAGWVVLGEGLRARQAVALVLVSVASLGASVAHASAAVPR